MNGRDVPEGDQAPLPFKPRDWVAGAGDHSRVARVKDVYRDPDGTVLLDLVLYDLSGLRVGRMSPVEGGPRSFEPACDASGWERIAPPSFPVPLKWVPTAGGGLEARHVAARTLPPAAYVRRLKRPRPVKPHDDKLRAALQAIADGYNDPRALAKSVLGQD